MEKSKTSSQPPIELPFLSDTFSYFFDACQRSVLFMDILRKRGNNYLEHVSRGKPPVLVFDYEIVIDGRDFKERPVNYALARILPQEGIEIDPKKRPIVIIDPRAGHGPGIGGFKRESEIGVAMKKGHQVYLVIFYPDPVPGQSLADVEMAEVRFIEDVSRLHPNAESPSVIGNCQGGWASMLVGADRPDVTGPLVIAGSPLSYWSGITGMNPMRYRAGLTGGTWLTSFLSDLGNGIFDGAYLVAGFEDLNPANTYWSKLYHVYSNVDTEEERFLDFERWWGGFFSMTSEEIHYIVSNLFVGNLLERGDLELGKGKRIDLGNLKDPVVVFASKGDNITPPQQALNWISKIYGSVDEIKRQQQVLVYMVHENVGHLGIFVSGSVAQKEHTEIVESLDHIEFLPPGLYEMIIEEKADGLPGDYGVRFEERGMEDILAMDDGFEEEKDFFVVKEVSEMYDRLYRKYLSPWVRMFTTEQSAELLRELHPLRVSRYWFSDLNPLLMPIKILAPQVKSNRRRVSDENTFLQIEKQMSRTVELWLDSYREIRDLYSEVVFKYIYGSPWLRSWLSKEKGVDEDPARIETDKKRIEELVQKDRERWMSAMDEGGFPEGVIRIMLAVANADRKFDRSEFAIVEQMGKTHKKLERFKAAKLRQIAKEQARILQTDQERAISALPGLLPTKKDRADALEIARDIIMADGVLAEEEKVLFARIEKILLPGKGKPGKKKKSKVRGSRK